MSGWTAGAGSPVGDAEIAEARAWGETSPTFEAQLAAIAADESRPADERELAKWMLEGDSQ